MNWGFARVIGVAALFSHQAMAETTLRSYVQQSVGNNSESKSSDFMTNGSVASSISVTSDYLGSSAAATTSIEPAFGRLSVGVVAVQAGSGQGPGYYAAASSASTEAVTFRYQIASASNDTVTRLLFDVSADASNPTFSGVYGVNFYIASLSDTFGSPIQVQGGYAGDSSSVSASTQSGTIDTVTSSRFVSQNYIDVIGASGTLNIIVSASMSALTGDAGTLAASFSLSGPATFSTEDSNLAFIMGVPEPVSWAMFIAGFGLIGMTMRRERYRLASNSPAII